MNPLPIMKSVFFAPLVALLLCLAVSLSPAQEATPQPAKEAGNDLAKQVLGYWVADFDSAATKAFLMTLGADEEIKSKMAGTTFEMKDGEMMVYEKNETSRVKITIKSQDSEKRTITADFQSENEDPSAVTLHVENDRLTMGEKNGEKEENFIGLMRIDKLEFEKRVPEALRNGEPDPQKKPIETEDGHPIAIPVPDRPGFVFSPYNNKIVDIRDIPSGTLVADPHFQPSEKKYFRAP